MKKLTVIPVVIGALGCISNCFESYIEKIGVQVVQKTALLGTANILRKALSKLDISYDMGGPLSTCY